MGVSTYKCVYSLCVLTHAKHCFLLLLLLESQKAQECIRFITLIPHCSLSNFCGWQIAHNPPLFLAFVPSALGFRSSSHQNMDAISLLPEPGLPVTFFGPYNVREAALGLSSAYLLALLDPARLPHDRAWLTCWRTRDHVEQRRGDSRLTTSQLTWLQTQNA